MDIPSRYIKKRHIPTSTLDHVREFVGKPSKEQNNLVMKSTFDFNFDESYYEKTSKKGIK